jgi:hypothetical protein
MKRTLLIVALLCASSFAAVKGDGSTGSFIGGNGTSGCINCFNAVTSYTVFFYYKAPAVPNTTNVQAVTLICPEVCSVPDIEFDWNHTTAAQEDACVKATDYNPANIAPVSANTWYAITCTWDGSHVKSYKNGVQVTSVSSTATSTNKVLPAAFVNATPNGSLAEFAFWDNVVCTPNQILAMSKGVRPTLACPNASTYYTFWATNASTSTNEPDLSGCLSAASCQGNNASHPATGQYNASGSPGFSGFTIVNHAPVTPFSREEEAGQ